MPYDDTPLEDLLRRRSWENAAGGQVCGDAELLAAYAEGRLPSKPRARLEEHLAACGACQTAVVRLMRLAPQESASGAAGAEREAERKRAPEFRWRWALPALAGVALAGSFVYHQRSAIVAPPSAPSSVASNRSIPAPESEAPVSGQPQGAVSPQPAPTEESRRRENEAGGKISRPAPASAAGDLRAQALAKDTAQQERLQQQPAMGGAGAQQAAAPGASVRAPMAGVVAAPPPPAAAPVPVIARPSPAAPPAPAETERRDLADKVAVDKAAAAPAAAPGGPKKEVQAPLDESRAKSAVAPRSKTAEKDKLGVVGGVAGVGGGAVRAPDAARAAAASDDNKQQQMAPGADRYAQRAATEQKPAAEAGRRDSAATGQKESAAAQKGTAAGQENAAAGNRMSMEARKAEAFGTFRKRLVTGTRRLALTLSGQLLAAPAQSNEWQVLAIPSGAAVTDFSVSGEHLWVLLPGGRVGHSPDLGRTWDPPVETGADDARSILFTNPRLGEILTRSGRRLRTADGGETWRQP